MSFFEMNLWAVLLAVIANQALGFAWYSRRCFGAAWMRESGLDPQALAQRSPRKPIVLSVLASIPLAVAIGYVLGMMERHTLRDGIVVGLLLGVAVAAMAAAPHYAFPGRSLRLYLIDQGYTVAAILVMTVILAVWP